MTNHDCTEQLAGLLTIDISEALRLLNGFSSAMVAELLAQGKLSIKGLGMFTVTHVPPEKKSTSSGTVYTPPANRLVFDSRISGADDTLRIAVSRVSMSSEQAVRFGRSLASILTEAVKQKREIVLNGFGRFSFDKGSYGFVPERSLEQLFNKEYQDLKEIVVSRLEPVQGKSKWKMPPYLVPLSAFALAVFLLFAVLFTMRRTDIHIALPSFVKQSRRSLPPAALPKAVGVKVTPHAVPVAQVGAVDSVVLEKGEYTIVLATFHTKKRALKKLAPLRSEGITSFIWPAYTDSVTYYRLMTGKFSSLSAASEHLKTMHETTFGGRPYIQQVIKSVVLHREKEF
ncbi:MAG: SPOR domain-containing protein [Chlorobiaceae bacterium]